MAGLYLLGWLRGANTLRMDSDHPLMYESDCDFCMQLTKAYVAKTSCNQLFDCLILLCIAYQDQFALLYNGSQIMNVLCSGRLHLHCMSQELFHVPPTTG